MSLGEKLADLIPERTVGWFHDHPHVLVLLSGALIAYHIFELVDACELYQEAKRFVGDVQREASEALGG